MSLIGRLHATGVFERRIRILSQLVAAELPPGARVLDVGCGDGAIAQRIMTRRPDVAVQGIDVLVRPDPKIPVTPFDGRVVPFADDSFDVATFVDVLHHTEDPLPLLREAGRVARTHVVIKDHICDAWMATATLRLMDYVGNAHHGVVLPYNYWTERRWLAAFHALGWQLGRWNPRLALYPVPGHWVFDRSLHFVARLDLR